MGLGGGWGGVWWGWRDGAGVLVGVVMMDLVGYGVRGGEGGGGEAAGFRLVSIKTLESVSTHLSK